MYAILSHGGRQHRVSAGDRLVVDRLDAEVGSVIALAPVLLTGGDGETAVGDAVDGTRVAVTVVKHLRGEKLRIFKYKAKKRSRKMAGYRSELTEVRVESILAKGAALPKTASAGAERTPAPAPAKRAPATSARRTTAKPAAKRTPARPEASAKSAPRPAAKRAQPGAASTAKPGAARTTRGAGRKAATKETGDGA